jgi:Cu/Ag efflux protein CusF
MKQLAVTLFALAAALSAALPAAAQTKAEDHSAHHAYGKADAALAEGEVRRINTEQKKITLRHGELKALDMPAMTMVFNVRDAALLDKLKVGDKVKFAAEKTPTGEFFVTRIEAAN